MKKAIITGGSSFHQNFFINKDAKYSNFYDEKIYLANLKDKDLSEFDLVVFASRMYPKFMRENFEKILNYLKNDGNVLMFPDLISGLFNHITYETGQVNFWWWISQNADLPMYKANENSTLWNFLEVKECKWHYHGTFKHGGEVEKLLVDELGRSILCKDEKTFKGSLYLSALDPDFHLGQGFMPITEVFFDKFMKWLEFDINSKEK
ncbi:hypothetical protein FMM58_05045 [Campylobacter sp. LR291e]|uniref:hypothetical protein n=1 Tax=unclassified Campylobacter TaxID=2593542 RepID=UPI0012382284|nr:MULTISPECIES: hypothetical protein [unclassified Campylobacter]KAA6225403.1 hypothetical protein FMM54_06475 [Campylobacter sp. LR185c]KAA6229535.1 hypothetical protein FMM56_08290 [Campylobacter sp. LR264d]KAA6230779.1 hypothetical protein FMM58_05045 [Campylobacter sp. LR291e]KAA8604906.1 hypothetical protein CGP82_00620 [Campylobacter sp. LR185c]